LVNPKEDRAAEAKREKYLLKDLKIKINLLVHQLIIILG
jgi:hypothetical protein